MKSNEIKDQEEKVSLLKVVLEKAHFKFNIFDIIPNFGKIKLYIVFLAVTKINFGYCRFFLIQITGTNSKRRGAILKKFTIGNSIMS